jgi:hypothetical protein
VSEFPAVAWRAQQVTISWLRRPPDALTEAMAHCLMYLGKADGVTVLFDVDTKTVHRLPTGELVVHAAQSPAAGNAHCSRLTR